MNFAERLLSKILQDELNENPKIVSEAARLFEAQQSRRTELHLINLLTALNTGQLEPYKVPQIAMATQVDFPLERRTQVQKTPLDHYLTFPKFQKPEEVGSESPDEEELLAFYLGDTTRPAYPLPDRLYIVDAGLDNGQTKRLYLVTPLKDTRFLRQALGKYARGNDAQKAKAAKALRTTFWSDKAEEAARFLKNRLIQDLATRNDPKARADYQAILRQEAGPRANEIEQTRFAMQLSLLQKIPALKGHSWSDISRRFERMVSILLRKTGRDLFVLKDEIYEKFDETQRTLGIPVVTYNTTAFILVGALASWQASDFPDEDVKFKRIPNKWARKRKWRDTRIPTK